MKSAATSESAAAPSAAPRLHRSPSVSERLRVTVHGAESRYAQLARDVRAGLQGAPKFLPPKYFYDDRGAQLFDAICDLPEYYLTRTEQALLQSAADEIITVSEPAEIVEFGSGASRKTRVVLDAVERAGIEAWYIPMDVSEGMLRRAAAQLLEDYPWLRVHAVVADYEVHLERLPAGRQRLILFLGSTLGNFDRYATKRFLGGVRRRLSPGDHLLLGVDLVKSVDVLEAAYNDRAGVTAAFNRNILQVINTQLDATFEPDAFDHVAFFDRAQSQIEMHLRARQAQRVAVRRLQLDVHFAARETIHTEISRKFTADELRAGLGAAGFALTRWYTPPNNYFGVALARAV